MSERYQPPTSSSHEPQRVHSGTGEAPWSPSIFDLAHGPSQSAEAWSTSSPWVVEMEADVSASPAATIEAYVLYLVRTVRSKVLIIAYLSSKASRSSPSESLIRKLSCHIMSLLISEKVGILDKLSAATATWHNAIDS